MNRARTEGHLLEFSRHSSEVGLVRRHGDERRVIDLVHDTGLKADLVCDPPGQLHTGIGYRLKAEQGARRDEEVLVRLDDFRTEDRRQETRVDLQAAVAVKEVTHVGIVEIRREITISALCVGRCTGNDCSVKTTAALFGRRLADVDPELIDLEGIRVLMSKELVAVCGARVVAGIHLRSLQALVVARGQDAIDLDHVEEVTHAGAEA